MTKRARRLGILAAFASLGVLIIGGVSAGAAQGGAHIRDFAAHTSLTRTYNWAISKTDDRHSAVTLAIGESLVVNYTVTVTNTGFTDSNWAVNDGMPIEGDGFTINSLADLSASADQGGTITPGTVNVCSLNPDYSDPVSFPFTGDFLGCHWAIGLPSGNPGVVTVGATFSDASTATNTKAFDFTNPTSLTEVDKCVDLSDTFPGSNVTGSMCVGDSPKTFNYSRVIGPYDTCGHFTVDNTASVTGHDSHNVLAHATDSIAVTVPCHGTGCTLTQGYWKTHSKYGPAAKPDPAWNLLPGGLGPDTKFFLSGKTWYQVFWTTPAGGNVYYILAHQYEAARLNILNGASSTAAVDSAIAWSTTFFNTYTPSSSLSSSVKSAANAAATTLGSYNEGAIGPGHCSE